MGRNWKKIEKGMYVVGEYVFFRLMVNGKREMEKAPMQGALALDSRGRPTKDLRNSFMNWKMRLMNRDYVKETKGNGTPTMKEMLEIYEEAADRQRVKTGKPGEFTEYTVKHNFRRVVEGCDLSMDDKCEKLTEVAIDEYVYRSIKKGLAQVTVWSYVESVKSMTARWTEPYFEARGFKRPEFKLPAHKGRNSGRYRRLPDEVKKKILEWYNGLWDRNREWWFFATMMLMFAMRDGDVFRIEWGKTLARDNEGKMWLDYEPHKTAKSSGRRVRAIVPKEVADRIEEMAKGKSYGERIVWVERWYSLDPVTLNGNKSRWLKPLNEELRKTAGMEGSKALYELRKLCVDHYYRTKGAEAAVAISGDDIKTVSYFYSDPSGVGTDKPVTVEEIL